MQISKRDQRADPHTSEVNERHPWSPLPSFFISLFAYSPSTFARTMLKAGIVGLPNVGKSTLFNAVTRTRKAQAANYPFCTIDPNVGVVTVPDERLEVLAKIAKTAVLIPAAIEFEIGRAHV